MLVCPLNVLQRWRRRYLCLSIPKIVRCFHRTSKGSSSVHLSWSIGFDDHVSLFVRRSLCYRLLSRALISLPPPHHHQATRLGWLPAPHSLHQTQNYGWVAAWRGTPIVCVNNLTLVDTISFSYGWYRWFCVASCSQVGGDLEWIQLGYYQRLSLLWGQGD
jgi:hypothetical protein